MRPARVRALRRWGRRAAFAAVSGFVAAQAVPYGRATEPQVGPSPAVWSDAEAEAVARSACYACHSASTERPWYAAVAPASWIVQRDIDSGRDELDFSRWVEGEGEDAAEVVVDGSMPPRSYQLLHPEARLTDEQRARLVAGLLALDR
jgi:mono/diheme cytochrome c family protein